jgi:hypothetical protein
MAKKNPAPKIKIPAPKQSGDCIKIDGMTVCPHLVYLKRGSKKHKSAVRQIHREIVAEAKKRESA